MSQVKLRVEFPPDVIAAMEEVGRASVVKSLTYSFYYYTPKEFRQAYDIAEILAKALAMGNVKVEIAKEQEDAVLRTFEGKT